MGISKMTEGIYKLSTNMESILFEGVWEIPHGVSLNSYVVKGEKTALIDGFCGWDGVPETFFSMLDQMDVSLDSLDYIVINHVEPDHSGWIENIKTFKKDITILCTRAAEKMLGAFYEGDMTIQTVKDGDVFDLGQGKSLAFYCTPNVHWPDTMVTFEAQSGTLFTCDAFGSFGSVKGDGFDDDLTEEAIEFYEKEAVRYYSNILATFSNFVERAIEKCEKLPYQIIAPGHGIAWRQNPDKIINDYKRYAAYQTEVDKKKITLLWGSMYGMTARGVAFIEKEFEKYDVELASYEIPETSWGTALASVWESSAVILAMPTYEYKMFPPMAAVLEELGKKKVQNRLLFRIGSYGWSGGAEKELREILDRYQMNWQKLDSVEFNGAPNQDAFDAIGKSIKVLISQLEEQ